MTAPQITAPQAPIDSHRQAQTHCLANIYVGRAPLGRWAKLGINAGPPAPPPSLPSPSCACPAPGGGGGWHKQFWGCASQSPLMEKQQASLI